MRTTKFSGAQLKALRQEAKLTQKDLAGMIGISRETVIAIEREHEGTIKSLEMSLVNQWWIICRDLVSQQSRHAFVTYVTSYFGLNDK